MINIGICKLGIRNLELTQEKNGMFKELDLLYQNFLFLKDKLEKKGKVINIKKISADNKGEYFDYILMFNGIANTETINELEEYSCRCRKLIYIVTDLRLLNKEYLHYFDILFTQSMFTLKGTENIEQYYSNIPELLFMDCNYDSRKIFADEKPYKFIFGGGMRDREEDFYKYLIVKFENEIFAKSKDYLLFIKAEDIDSRISTEQYNYTLEKTRYSLLIMDKLYNDERFITWRFYENLAKGVLTFIDKNTNIESLRFKEILRKFFVVESKAELWSKMEYLDKNPKLRKTMLQEQLTFIFDCIKREPNTFTAERMFNIIDRPTIFGGKRK